MKIEKVITGLIQENCYILTLDDEVLVIDPGDDYDKIINKINDKEIIGILITHNHYDHVGALKYFDKNIPIYNEDNLSEEINVINDFIFKVIYTPGHTSDSITYYFEKEKIMFTGDFLFKEEIGRCDLPTGDYPSMLNSLEKIITYPKDITIYPGHGDSSTIKDEMQNNYYIINLEKEKNDR